MTQYAFQNQETLKFATFSKVENKHSCQIYLIDPESDLEGATKFRILSHKKKAFALAIKHYNEERKDRIRYPDEWKIVELQTRVVNVLD